MLPGMVIPPFPPFMKKFSLLSSPNLAWLLSSQEGRSPLQHCLLYLLNLQQMSLRVSWAMLSGLDLPAQSSAAFPELTTFPSHSLGTHFAQIFCGLAQKLA